MDQSEHFSNSHQHHAEQTSKAANQSLSKNGMTLRGCVEVTMQNYFEQLGGQPTSDVYDMVLHEVEAPLFAMVMRYVGDNQTKASELLGINRGTLRKKLKQYDLL